MNQTNTEESELFAALGLASLRSEPSRPIPSPKQAGETSTTSRLTEQEAISNKTTSQDKKSESTSSKNLKQNTNNVNNTEDDNKYSNLSFTQKLYKILHDDKYQDVIRFAPESDAFIQFVNKKRLCDEVLPLVFNETQYKSFIRTLTRWNFHKVTKGQFAGSYYHEHFRKNKPNLCSLIRNDSSNKTTKTRAISLIKEEAKIKNNSILKENMTDKRVSNVKKNVPNQQSELVKRATVIPDSVAEEEEEVKNPPPSVVQEVAPSNMAFLPHTQEQPSSPMIPSSIPAASTSSDLYIQLMRREIEERLLSELQQRAIEINRLNMLTRYIAEAQQQLNIASRPPVLSNNNYSSPPLRDLITQNIITNMNGNGNSPQMNTQNILDYLRSVLR